MIRYDLICDKGHEFDGWFADSSSFDEQAARGLVNCSHCGSSQISKQLMMPGISSKSNAARRDDGSAARGSEQPEAKQMRDMILAYRRAVEANAEYVGDRFAEEARRIYYKESKERGIYGEARMEEAAALIEEGIAVHPLPHLPEDLN